MTDLLTVQPGVADELRDLGWDDEEIQRHAPEPEPDSDEAGADSWRPVDLESILDGTYVAPEASVGHRDDGAGMFYPGRIHSVFAEPESGKTWLMAFVSAGEITAGNDVLYLDFEDSPEGIVTRLRALGLSAEQILAHFRYIRPACAPGIGGTAELLAAITPTTTLATIDGVTEAMSMFGMKTKDDTDVAAFGRRLPGLIAKRGPAVVQLDHVVKDRESRGRWATGSQHKLSGLNGSAFRLESVASFGIGVKGRSRLLVAKDRPAQVRRNAVRAKIGDWFADLVIDSKPDGSVFANLYPPIVQEGPVRPVRLMKAVCDVLAKAERPMSWRDITARVEGKDESIRRAVAVLVDEEYVKVTAGPRNANLHEMAKPFAEGE